MKNQQLYLKVHPYLWEYYRGFYGSEIIEVKEHPLLSIRIKTVLTTKPESYPSRRWSDFRIIVLNLPYFRIGDKRINVDCRRFLDDTHQYLISQELYLDFKNSFLNFMLGYIKNGGTQADGIKTFCDFYNFEMNTIKTDTLKKIWDRSELKERWNIERGVLIKVKKHRKNITTLSPCLIQ